MIPRGGCSEVISTVKTLRAVPNLHHMQIYGIIDRDFKEDDQLAKYTNQNIYPVKVAEIENFLCVPELILYVAKTQLLNSDSILEKVKSYIIESFEKELELQVSKKVSLIIKYKLNSFDDKSNGVANIRRQYLQLTGDIDIESLFNHYKKIFSKLIDKKDYLGILTIYNRKKLPERISSILGFSNKEYPNFVLRLLSSSKKDEVIDILKDYTPEIDAGLTN